MIELEQKIEEMLDDIRTESCLSQSKNEPEAIKLTKYRGSVRKLATLVKSSEGALSNDEIPFYRSVSEALVQPEAVQSGVRALLTLLTMDYNPDSAVMAEAVKTFNGEGGAEGTNASGKGIGYLRALGEAGRRVQKGDWASVFGLGLEGGEEKEVNKGGEEEGESGGENAVLQTELDMLSTLHKSKYLLGLITECKTLTRKCKQFKMLSNSNDRDEDVRESWKELLSRYRWCSELINEDVYFR